MKPAFFITKYSKGYSSLKAAKLSNKDFMTEYSLFVKAIYESDIVL